MNGGLSLAIPCRADEPGLGAMLASLLTACQHPALASQIAELVICLNGLAPHSSSASLVAVREFCSHSGIPMQEVWVGDHYDEPDKQQLVMPAQAGIQECQTLASDDSPWIPAFAGMTPQPLTLPIPECTLLLTERRGKPPAWNMLWRQAKGTAVLFCDADVRIDAEAVWLLYERLRQNPQLALVAAREAPVLEGGGTMWSRMGALPYRFDFGNAGGRLLLLRKDVLPDGMPEDLLLEDAWLTVAVGKQRVAKEWRAKVYFLPPATGRDYFAERVRTEGGKLQIRRVHRELLEDGPIATYCWSRFFTAIAPREYPLALMALLIRGLAHCWARLALINKDFYALYRPFLTTKEWSET